MSCRSLGIADLNPHGVLMEAKWKKRFCSCFYGRLALEYPSGGEVSAMVYRRKLISEALRILAGVRRLAVS